VGFHDCVIDVYVPIWLLMIDVTHGCRHAAISIAPSASPHSLFVAVTTAKRLPPPLRRAHPLQ
jgi:hypothetical protein